MRGIWHNFIPTCQLAEFLQRVLTPNVGGRAEHELLCNIVKQPTVVHHHKSDHIEWWVNVTPRYITLSVF
jgi:hypothetical protein